MKRFKKHIPLIYITFVTLFLALVPMSKRGYNVVEMDPEPLLSEGEYAISPYDNIFRRVARRHNLDWRLLSAIAYCESRFNPEAQSPRGAVGMMQVMPHIARHWDVTAEELLDPAINIDVACRLYKSTFKQLKLPKEVAEYDRIAFTIASYNCGASRVTDARNLAEYYEEQKNDWASVCEYMLLLTEEEFYNHEAVLGGRFKEPHITIAYTKKVLSCYERYKKIIE